MTKSGGKLYFMIAGISSHGKPFFNSSVKYVGSTVDEHYILTTYAPGYTGGVPVEMKDKVKHWKEKEETGRPFFVLYSDEPDGLAMLEKFYSYLWAYGFGVRNELEYDDYLKYGELLDLVDNRNKAAKLGGGFSFG